LSIPLSESWTNTSVNVNHINPGGRPQRQQPVLWPTVGGFYSYGGWSDAHDKSELENQVWQFLADGAGGGSWSRGSDIERSALNGLDGGSCSSANQVGYCYGGRHVFWEPDNASQYNLSTGIVSYNWTVDNWTYEKSNKPEPSIIGGLSQTIPDLGPQGLFLSIGEVQVEDYHFTDPHDLTYQAPVGMDTVSIYEPITKKWYLQSTTGPTPPSRAYGCSVLAKSTAGSYELYVSAPCSKPLITNVFRFVYGGIEASFNTHGRVFSYNDVHILTIPGFNWISVKQDNAAYPGPRAFHTCNLVGNRQAFILGGFNYRNTSIDYLDVDPLMQGIGIFDMSMLTWKDAYDAQASAYEQPQAVAAWYTTANSDSVDWVSDDLRSFFQTGDTIWSTNTSSSSSGTSPSGKPSTDNAAPATPSHTGAIAGGIVGGILGLFLIASLIWVLSRKRHGLPVFRRSRKGPYSDSGYEGKPELPTDSPAPQSGPPASQESQRRPSFELPASNLNELPLASSRLPPGELQADTSEKASPLSIGVRLHEMP
jgi:hypothetical protein